MITFFLGVGSHIIAASVAQHPHDTPPEFRLPSMVTN
jgi:hypothetical protein